MVIVFANLGATMMLLAGSVLLVYTLMRKAHLRQEADRQSRIVTDLHALPMTQKGRVEGADLARDLNGQIAAKTIVLEKLIADSQRQIERMEQLLERLESANRSE